MMRVVLDTNVLARVVMSPTGPAGELFDRIRADHLLIVSAELLAEFSRVLAYDRVRRIHGLDDAGIEHFVEALEAGALVASLPDPLPRVVPDDPDDDQVVATAVVGAANSICTLNKHLHHPDVVVYCRQRAIEIVNDATLLGQLRSSQP